MTERLRTVLVVTSTLPAHESDPVPAFVAEQMTALKAEYPELSIDVLAPHNAYEDTKGRVQRDGFTEHRFHYFWPFRFEVLAGRGIGPALKQNKLLYALVPFLIVFEAIAIMRHVHRQRPDVIYAHWFMPQALAAMPAVIFQRVPLVVTTHASDVAVLRGIPGAAQLVRFVSRRVHSFSAVSEQTADKLRAFWPKRGAGRTMLDKKLHIIPMGTSLKAGTRKRQPGEALTILFMGRLVERKGVVDLLEAFARVRKGRNDVQLIIAGDGQERGRFEAHAKQLGVAEAVTFIGYVNGTQKTDLFTQATILCIPSVNDGVHAEGLPVVFMEGLAAGLVVVSSDVTGAQEWVTDGRDGYLYEQRDVAALTRVLRKVLDMSSSERQMIAKGARLLAKNFEWRNVVRRQYTMLENAYNETDHS